MTKFCKIVFLLFFLSSLLVHGQCPEALDSIEIQHVDSTWFSDLKEITVTAKRPGVIVKADKITYLPSAMISGGQGNIYDGLMSIPGLKIDEDGSISINGIQNIAVQIDGQKLVLSGRELLSYLRAASLSNFDKIDIISLPRAKTEMTEPTTVVNLQRRRNRDNGCNIGTSIDGQIGRARQLYGSINIEYGHSKHNIVASLSKFIARNPSELLTDRPYLNYQERLIQMYDRLRKDAMCNMSISYNYNIQHEMLCGASVNYNYHRRNEPAIMTTDIPFEPDIKVTSNNARWLYNELYG